MSEVAVLGTGRMGGAMVARLVQAGHRVTLWNRSDARGQEVARDTGATLAGTPAEAVGQVDVVISMLSSGEVTESVLLEEQVRSALRPGTVVCDMGTSGVACALALDAALTPLGVRCLDAPVSGSVATVAAGQLLVMAGGDEQVVRTIEPVLLAFAKRVIHLGPIGSGQAMKLSVNLVVHTLNAGLSEALALSTSAGVSRRAAYEVFLESVIAAPFVVYKRAAFLDPDAPVAMSLDLTQKDLRLITGFARDQLVPSAVAQAVSDEVSAACAAGLGDRDMADLARYLESEIGR